MKLVREYINEKFTEKSDPIIDMNIGHGSKLTKLQNKKEYLTEKDFDDDNFIVYLFEKEYHKWSKMAELITPDSIEIWSDITSGNSPIIKIAAPGVKETTLIRGDSDYYHYISKDITDFLRSPEMKAKLTSQFRNDAQSLNKLTQLIYTSSSRKKLQMEGIYIAEKIAKRLIKILKNK